MRIQSLAFLLMAWAVSFSIATAQTSAAPADSSAMLIGKWAGTYEGSDAGKFDLIINQDNTRKLTGQVVMLAPDGNRYPIDLKVITWQNGKLNAAYADPQGGSDVTFSGTLEQSALKGNWRASDGMATGSWQATRADK
ncbi:hypothetical protein GGR92_000496 [Spirosoma lacussanchae]|uniref:hypothetical protein n=1 Tax=Spirosoma lacussanchae TaxID=1884249 RepID=UPI001FE279F4|nr:hypothetical protein [Spirosoma lacussanchae]